MSGIQTVDLNQYDLVTAPYVSLTLVLLIAHGADRVRSLTCASAWHQGEAQEYGFRASNRNILYLITGALAAVAVVLGKKLYQERQKTTGVDIRIGERGISIEKK